MSHVKKCSKCNETKIISDFDKRTGSKDGYAGVCKLCKKIAREKYINTCTICNKEYRTHKKDSLYCSLQCAGEGHKDRKSTDCAYCGKIVIRKKNHIERNKNSFCSVECANKYMSEFMNKENSHNWQDIKTNCSQCGKEIKINKYKLKTNTNCFCSRKCFSEYNSIHLRGSNNPVYGKILHSIRGENSPHWKPHLTKQEREGKRSIEGIYEFRTGVFRRDNFICKCCGYDKGKILVAHHLNSYDNHKEQRVDINNGITLCKKCHIKFHNKYGYGNNTLEQFNDFIQNMAIPSQASETHKSN